MFKVGDIILTTSGVTGEITRINKGQRLPILIHWSTSNNKFFFDYSERTLLSAGVKIISKEPLDPQEWL